MSKMPTLTITEDRTDEFNAIIKRFRRDDVLVGIPQQDTTREPAENADGVQSEINNATLLAINEFGSPAQNIPARPVMAIGIRAAQKEIAEQFKQAMLGAFKTGISALSTYYNRAGIIASTSIKKTINAQEGIKEPSEATLETRRAQGFKGTKALIVTGQMRNAITYVVKGEG